MINHFLGEDKTKGLRKTFENMLVYCAGCRDVAKTNEYPIQAEVIRHLCEENDPEYAKVKRRKV